MPVQDKITAQALNGIRSPGALWQLAQVPWHWLPTCPPPQHGADTRLMTLFIVGSVPPRTWDQPDLHGGPGDEWVPLWVPCVLLCHLALKCCGCGIGAVLQGGAGTAVSSYCCVQLQCMGSSSWCGQY